MHWKPASAASALAACSSAAYSARSCPPAPQLCLPRHDLPRTKAAPASFKKYCLSGFADFGELYCFETAGSAQERKSSTSGCCCYHSNSSTHSIYFAGVTAVPGTLITPKCEQHHPLSLSVSVLKDSYSVAGYFRLEVEKCGKLEHDLCSTIATAAAGGDYYC